MIFRLFLFTSLFFPALAQAQCSTCSECIIISEFASRPNDDDADGESNDTGEFIELFNKCESAVDISCYVVSLTDDTFINGLVGRGDCVTIPSGTILAPGDTYLLGGDGTNCSNGKTSCDWPGISLDYNWHSNPLEVWNVDEDQFHTTTTNSFIGVLNNPGEEIGLFSCEGNFLEGFYYEDGSGPDYVTIENIPTINGCAAKTITVDKSLMIDVGDASTGDDGVDAGYQRDCNNDWSFAQASSSTIYIQQTPGVAPVSCTLESCLDAAECDAVISGGISICEGGAMPELSISFLSGVAPWTVVLNDNSFFTTSTNPFKFTPSSAGTYSIQSLSDNAGCSNSTIISETTISITPVEALFSANTEFGSPPLIVEFQNESTPEEVSTEWDFNSDGQIDDENIDSPTYQFSDTGTYIVTLYVETQGGCPSEYTKKIIVSNLDTSSVTMPNVFTPGNGDDVNKFFKPISINMIKEHLKVYNRWGMLLFDENKVGVQWDGTNKAGEPVPDGTYFYIYTATGIDGEEYMKSNKKDTSCSACNGSFSLLRK